jgi:hypothetical protein
MSIIVDVVTAAIEPLTDAIKELIRQSPNASTYIASFITIIVSIRVIF